ncbi:MAG: fibronectin type III domain-containing protein, partial [bacterium]|nr:fibronectin type III domain-containing protein [bacterium]
GANQWYGRSSGESRDCSVGQWFSGFRQWFNNYRGSIMKRLFLIAMFVLWAGVSFAADVPLSWEASTAADLAGYKIHYGNESGVYVDSIDAGNVTEYTVTGLDDTKNYYFAVTVYDTEVPSLESDYSNEIFLRYRTDGPPAATTLHEAFWQILQSIWSKISGKGLRARWS